MYNFLCGAGLLVKYNGWFKIYIYILNWNKVIDGSIMYIGCRYVYVGFVGV